MLQFLHESLELCTDLFVLARSHAHILMPLLGRRTEQLEVGVLLSGVAGEVHQSRLNEGNDAGHFSKENKGKNSNNNKKP